MAFGGDPDNDEPGTRTGSTGRVDINAGEVSLAWNPQFLPELLELQPESDHSFLTLKRMTTNFPSE